ncbi:glycogen synthase [bacterium]|nr:glycogen synthase [bacterium]
MTLNVLFMAAEAEPFVKVGGLGDVAGALPGAIHQTSLANADSSQVDIRLVLPYHYAIKQKGFETTYLGEFDVQQVNGKEKCQVYQYDRGEIPVYFLDGLPVDEKSPVYAPTPLQDGYKFVFFSLAALQLAEFLEWRVDILQANDWHTATAIAALNLPRYRTPQLENCCTILTLHNLPFMGFGIQQALEEYGLPPVDDPILPEWAQHAALPMGLYYADRIVAVSPHYAEEVLTPDFGCGLENLLATRQDSLMGILNGVDIETWDPATDPHLLQNYSIETLTDRMKNKTALQHRFQLEERADIPLITLVSRMDPQKGIDIALRGLRLCANEPWQAIILGTGIPAVEAMALELQNEFPDRVRCVIDFDSELAHQLYAGADIFMMPSRYEPCGLSQMIAMRYGCVPVARETGGLADTIHHIGRKVNGGTGFLFKKPYPSAFSRALTRACRLFADPDKWRQIQINGMQTDFSWNRSARKYIDLYKTLMG